MLYQPTRLISPPFLAHHAYCGETLRWLDGRYAGDINAFTADVRLVFSNCRAYNPPGDWARAWGDSCGAAFEVGNLRERLMGQDMWNSMLQKT